jgi:adenine-specific DNA-methyltransferase
MINDATLKKFSKEDFKKSALNFFEKLGYSSDKNLISPDLLDLFYQEEVATAHFLFQLTDDEIKTQFPAFKSTEHAIDNSIILSYLFVGLELKKSSYSRTDLATILRNMNMNKHFKMPVLILFKYGNYLTLGTIHRRLHKKDIDKDVLEKVTLIKDIAIDNPHRAHLDILERLAFKNLSPKPTHFVELHLAWQNVLDISVLNKKFYLELSLLFTELVGGTHGKTVFNGLLKLPSPQNEKVLKEFAVRLMGRLLFCWFLQKKTSENGLSLIPTDILSSNALLNKNSNIDYYHTILEPLFFEVLNKPIADRNSLFKCTPWVYIPFLNGGLFEPHPHDFYDKKNCTLNTLHVPDEWLQKLIAFFERYHFTIEENTPLDVQVAIDPEMLGQIFENLLAEINPETGETARKATGSYYTPREIVDYMVNESLMAYFTSQCPDLSIDKLRDLFAYETLENPFNTEDSDRLLSAINTIKIFDPACGSGAFPMGILQKLTWLLSRLDKDCSKWLVHTLNGISNVSTRRLMQKKLEGERMLWNYARKLGILGQCIYGVDIQIIAVEISRLRCFLSLVVDEKVEDDQPNRGIIPLPNLNFKFICANTLIGLGKENYQSSLFEQNEDAQKLADLRADYFAEQDLENKKAIQLEFNAIQGKMFKQLFDWNRDTNKSNETLQLASWNPFIDDSCPWFDSFWMFGIEKGEEFDIVIGNPPYLRVQNLKETDKKEYAKYFYSATGAYDLYVLFNEKGLIFLNEKGILNFIQPDKWINSGFGKGLRKITKNHIAKLISFKQYQVFNASTYSSLLWLKNETQKKLLYTELNKELSNKEDLKLWLNELNEYSFNSFDNYKGDILYCFSKKLNKSIEIEKNFTKPCLMGKEVHRYKKPTSKNVVVFPYLIKDNKAVLFSQEEIKSRFPLAWKYLLENRQSLESRERNRMVGNNFYAYIYPKNLTEFNAVKLMTPDICGKPEFTIDESGELYHVTTLYSFVFNNKANASEKYYLGLLNSKLMWYFQTVTGNVLRGGFFRFTTQYLKPFPIPKSTLIQQKTIEKLVDQILALKQQGKDSRELEQEIDRMVYRLYDLSEEEINIILSQK